MASEAEVKECFMVHDKLSDGSLTVQEAEMAVRALGLNCSQTQLHNLAAKITGGARSVTLDEFQKIYTQAKAIDVDTSGLKSAFEKFEKGASDISGAELKYILSAMGERMHENEASEILQLGGLTDESKITSAAFLEMATATH
eukprot:m.20705 g.20705  ORF g.20705 m.20705 type:complete len:143 (-) comp13058_c0_seq1:64-492(-)